MHYFSDSKVAAQDLSLDWSGCNYSSVSNNNIGNTAAYPWMMIMFELWSIKLKLFKLFSDWVLDSGEEGVLIYRCTTRTGVLQELLTELVPLFILYGIHQQTEKREILLMTWVCQENDCLLGRSNKTATAHYFRKVSFAMAAQLSVQNVWILCHLISLPYTRLRLTYIHKDL